jgi:hypothetical protein
MEEEEFIPDYQIFWVDREVEDEEGNPEMVHFFEVYDNHENKSLGMFQDYLSAEEFAEAWLVEMGY